MSPFFELHNWMMLEDCYSVIKFITNSSSKADALKIGKELRSIVLRNSWKFNFMLRGVKILDSPSAACLLL
jgi:hypothetical protein